mgnify:FL=1
MANWANISRNAKTHGDFAGRSKAEQDAYFEFFAGSEPSTLKSIFVSFRRVFDKVEGTRTAHGLLGRIAGVASSKLTTS